MRRALALAAALMMTLCLTCGALAAVILEVGSSGNTLQEALAAVRLFAQPAAVALTALVEQGG